MTKTRRIGLYVGLAILASQAVADAQTPTGDPTQPAAGAQLRPAAGPRRASPTARDASTAAPPATARRRPPASTYYNRVTATSSRSSSAGAYGANDPLRPYSAQGRQSAGTISSTRQAEAPPPPPRVVPQSRYNYYPGMRGSQHPNANAPHRCTPSRGGVMAGSLGGGAMMGGGLTGRSLGGGGGGRGR